MLRQVQRDVIPNACTQRRFDHGYHVTQYANDIINKNSGFGRELDTYDVALHWAIEVRKMYPNDYAKREELVSQVGYVASEHLSLALPDGLPTTDLQPPL